VAPLGFGLILLVLIMATVAVIVVSGSRTQEQLGAVLFVAIAVGWAVLGYALWSQRPAR
jgi:hypothetical protein